MIHFVPVRERVWVTVSPGVEFSVVHRFGAGRAMFVRMAAGAVAPLHTHDGGEETCLLSGRLRVGEHVLEPGDYLWTPSGIEHDGVAEEQTVFFVVLPKGLAPSRSGSIPSGRSP